MNDQRRKPLAAAVSGQSTAADYALTITPAPCHIRGEVSGHAIVDSRRAFVLRETRHAPTYYFPREDVRMDLLRQTKHHTHCPFKGDATYWSVETGKPGDAGVENVAWSYDVPYPGIEQITGYIAFYTNKMDMWWEDGSCVSPQRDGMPAMSDMAALANPLSRWIINEAWEATTSRELTARFARQLNECGMSLTRLRVIIQTLHPLIVAMAYRWQNDAEDVERFEVSNALHEEVKFTKSPLTHIFEGLGGVRRWISPDDDGDEDEYSIMADLRAEGATDYVAMPMRFSDGQINAVTLATDAPEGFNTQHLGWLHEILPALSRYYEVHAKRRAASALMKTFLGSYTGERVLDGLVKRGDGEDIHAVIWFCDLRDSTPIADSIGREEFLGYLNQFFDCMAGAVLDNEGEVLRYVGDAVLAIFPIKETSGDAVREGECPACDACARAAKAAREAGRRIAVANAECRERGLPYMDYGIGMHVGTVAYGNIGTADRLEFTVVGRAANEAARIEGLSKELQRNALVSQAFKDAYGGELEPLGEHVLRGVGAPQAIYALSDDIAD